MSTRRSLRTSPHFLLNISGEHAPTDSYEDQSPSFSDMPELSTPQRYAKRYIDTGVRFGYGAHK